MVLPEPDPAAWRAQLLGVYSQIRDLYLDYPGVSRAALATVPTNRETLRVGEGILAILLADGVAPRPRGWARDAMSSTSAPTRWSSHWSGNDSRHQDQEWVLSHEELLDRFSALPAEEFPQTRRHAAELISGTGHDRFEFTLGLLMDNLRPESG